MLLLDPIRVTALKGIRHGYFPRRTRQRIDVNAAKSSCTNVLGLVFKKALDIQATGALVLLQALR